MLTGGVRRSRRRHDTRTGTGAEPRVVDVRRVLEPVGPEAVEVHARCVAVGGHLAATLVVTGYPAEVNPGWLGPLLSYPGRLDVALHVEPVPSVVAAERLRRQRARLESSRRSRMMRGRLDEPEGEAAAEDAAELAYRIARGEGRLFRVGLYLTVHAATEAALAEEVAAVRAVASSLLVTVQPTTYRALAGWLATLPLGLDTLKVRRTMDTAALAACFPFTSPDLPTPTDETGAPGGVLLGLNASSGAPVFFDRFAQDNYNSIVLARSGAGKSYLAKLELLRLLFTGVEAAVIDPEDEYVSLAEATGGQVIRLGEPGVCLNPFDLPARPCSQEPRDELTRQALFLHTFLAVLLGTELDSGQRAVLDAALLATYARAGITADPATWTLPPPVLADLHQVLTEEEGEAAGELAARLAPYVSGSHAGLFNGATTTSHARTHLVVFALRRLADEVRAPAILLALEAIWRRVTTGPVRRRLVVVDEAWTLMRQSDGARFLFRMAKSGRRHWCGLAVVTQDADDVLGSPLGRAVVANSATQVLLRQAPQAIDQIADAFHLSRGERDVLLTARRGEALLLNGRRHKALLTAVASPEEHVLITTDPTERPDQNEREPAWA
ncbi:VirB4 family type IV secretion system protein [Streptomyces sp. 4N509B]|uniref:VirB4 family type IV secretion system protein n=1 Tax=Streptomyces sp. 4N509B TaxID=3457413 RepID=UPI003FCFDE89